MPTELEEKLLSFLNLYWLRPENGLLSTFQSKVFDDIPFVSPSIDISCGDGLFDFIHFGGRLDDEIDFFQKTKAAKFSHDSFVDIFDSFDENYEVKISKNPQQKIDYGTDWKQSLLNKSEKLNFYKNLVLHDNNQLPLPFSDNFFKTIYSNAVYWTQKDKVKSLLDDIHRILHPDGTAILQVMTPSHLETLNDLSEFLSPKAIEILDRKRRDTMTIDWDTNDWKNLILVSDFKIKEIRNTYPNKLIMDIWNIGLRPIGHLLIQMSDSLPLEKRRQIKKEWVDIFYELFKPLLNIEEKYTDETQPYPCFILSK